MKFNVYIFYGTPSSTRCQAPNGNHDPSHNWAIKKKLSHPNTLVGWCAFPQWMVSISPTKQLRSNRPEPKNAMSRGAFTLQYILKHGVLENGLFISIYSWFSYSNLRSVRGFSSQPCLMTPESTSGEATLIPDPFPSHGPTSSRKVRSGRGALFAGTLPTMEPSVSEIAMSRPLKARHVKHIHHAYKDSNIDIDIEI